MAIGDSFAVFMGTAATNRQPASGVFEEVSSILKDGGADNVSIYDGTNVTEMFEAAVRIARDQADTASVRGNPYNMALKIGNTVYLRKVGTTDRIGASGVQVDA
jgi:hypothetical protein